MDEKQNLQGPEKNEVKTEEESKHKVDLDTILEEELGQFGLYQLRTMLLLAIAVTFVSWSGTDYVFTTTRIRTRCFISECESLQREADFLPDWWTNAIPAAGASFDNCQRFNSTGTTADTGDDDMCPAQLFDQQAVVPCEEYVYENTNSVVYEFGLACDEWRRTLIGTLRTAGILLGLPLTAFISDKWGRRTALSILSINSAWLGVLRYFANTYVGYVISQVVETVFGAGGFSCAYILFSEVVGPKYRVAASASMNTIYAIAQVLFGLIAWAVPNWRHLTLTLYLPQFLSISFFWILPESVRWYLSKKRYEEAEAILKNMARINRRQLSERSLQALRRNAEDERNKQELAQMKTEAEPWLVLLVFRYKPILLRCVVSPMWWITTTFIYYGLNINSVNISGNVYVNYIIVSAVEIPGYWTSFLAMNAVGRKPTLITGFWICAACQLAYLLISEDLVGLSLAVYFIGKWAIAVVMSTIYVYTAELYPTQYRHRLFAFSSMIGRFGAIVAPLTPAFGDNLPFILFGSFALAAGALVLLTPETRGARLPDTMEEAASTGRH